MIGRSHWVLYLLSAIVLLAGEWTAPTQVTRDGKTRLSARAKLAGEHLVVELQVANGWHIYAMDNEQRAKVALAGKMSLGVEKNTEVQVSGDLQVTGNWYQTDPTDFSRPELQWFTYGFENNALLASHIKFTGNKASQILVQGQICDSERCEDVKAQIVLPVSARNQDSFSIAGLVQVTNPEPIE